jgi:hypothetical protein
MYIYKLVAVPFHVNEAVSLYWLQFRHCGHGGRPVAHDVVGSALLAHAHVAAQPGKNHLLHYLYCIHNVTITYDLYYYTYYITYII